MVVHGELLFVGELPECSKSQSDPEAQRSAHLREVAQGSLVYTRYTLMLYDSPRHPKTLCLLSKSRY